MCDVLLTDQRDETRTPVADRPVGTQGNFPGADWPNGTQRNLPVSKLDVCDVGKTKFKKIRFVRDIFIILSVIIKIQYKIAFVINTVKKPKKRVKKGVFF